MVYNRLALVVRVFVMLCAMVLLAGVLVASIVLSSISRVVTLVMTSALVLMSLAWGYLSMIGFPDTVWTHGITQGSLFNAIYVIGLLYVVWSVVAWGSRQMFDKELLVETVENISSDMFKTIDFRGHE